MKKILALLFAASLLTTASEAKTSGNTKWINPAQAEQPSVHNQGWPEELKGTYHRLPARAESKVRKPLWELSRNSAGLQLKFKTNSPTIKFRYVVEGGMSMPHMPATGVSGVDMYRVKPDGTKEFCFGSYSFGDTVRFNYGNLTPVDLAGPAKDKIGSLAPTDFSGPADEYVVNLPLYNTVKFMEIGVEDGAKFELIPWKVEKPIVVYGTSIAHGACASRPGMAWANIVSRTLDMPLINLGFSGNGKLEPELIDFLNEIDASIYILDCMPNIYGKDEEQTKQLVIDAVKQIRGKSNTPILLVEHAGYSDANTNPDRMKAYTTVNRGQRMAFDELSEAGTPNLFYLTHDELNFSPDSWVDYVHPSDLGAQRQADEVVRKVHAILNK